MELEVLKKKLSTFKGEDGRIRNVSDELLLEVLSAWKLWQGTSYGFYKAIGSSQKGMVSMIGKTKRLKREGATIPFSEVQIEGITDTANPAPLICKVEVPE